MKNMRVIVPLILALTVASAFGMGRRPPPTPKPTATVRPSPTATATATATASANSAVGIMCLIPSDTVEDPISPDKLDKNLVWTNTHIKGVVIRSSWDRVEPSEGQYYWDYLDKGVALALEHGLKVSIMVTAGFDTPKFVCDADPTACWLALDTNGKMTNTNLPWNPTFQAKWKTFVEQLAARYDSKITHVDMAGYGRRAESFFVFTSDEQTAIEVIAKAAGFPDAHTSWLTSAKWVVDLYSQNFTHAFFITVMGSPWPDDAGGSMKSLTDDGASKYPGRFGAASHGLTSKRPVDGSLAMTLPRTIHIGFQVASTQGDDTASMATALDRGINAGAEWIEVTQGDCNNPKQAANLDAANAAILSK